MCFTMIDKTYKIDSNIIWRDVDGVVYILQPEREEIHALNETGTLIWKLMSKGYSLKQIQQRFVSLYNVSSQEAQSDIQEFVDRYIREKFFVPVKRNIKSKPGKS